MLPKRGSKNAENKLSFLQKTLALVEKKILKYAFNICRNG